MNKTLKFVVFFLTLWKLALCDDYFCSEEGRFADDTRDPRYDYIQCLEIQNQWFYHLDSCTNQTQFDPQTQSCVEYDDEEKDEITIQPETTIESIQTDKTTEFYSTTLNSTLTTIIPVVTTTILNPSTTVSKATTTMTTAVKPISTTPKPITTTQKLSTANTTTTKPITTTQKPTTAKPTTAKPTTAKPTTAKSTTAKPTTAKPTTAKSTTAKPTTAKSTTAKPTTSKPTTAKPTTAKPTTANPTTAKPVTAKPTTAKPITTKPITAKPTTTSTKSTTTIKPNEFKCKAEGYWPDETNCGIYHACIENFNAWVHYVMPCPATLVYCSQFGYCGYTTDCPQNPCKK